MAKLKISIDSDNDFNITVEAEALGHQAKFGIALSRVKTGERHIEYSERTEFDLHESEYKVKCSSSPCEEED